MGNKSIFVLIAMLALALGTPALGQVKTTPQTSRLTLKPIVFEVRDNQKVEADSGQFMVPETRGNKEAKLIALSFVRFKSTSQNPGSPIVYLAGGPGESGINDFRAVPLSLLNEMRAIADVIALDQRGTGISDPREVMCQSERQLPLDRPGDPAVFATIFRERMRECVDKLQRQGINLAAFTTEENAEDIETLRVALGAKRFTLFSGSYGSHLALAVIRRHSDHLERAVLFGTEGLDQTFKLPSNVQTNLEKLAALVRADSFYATAMPDLLGAIRKVIEQIERQPVTVNIAPDISVVVGKWDLQKRISDVMGRGSAMRQLPEAIYAMFFGDFTDLGRWAYNYRRDGRMSAMAVTMDCASFASTARLERIQREAHTTLLGATIDFPFPNICEGMKLPRLDDSFRQSFQSALPVLFVSGEMDGRTPVSNAEEVASGFRNHQHMFVANAAHGIMGYPELNPAVLAFLRGQRIPETRVSFPKWELRHPSKR